MLGWCLYTLKIYKWSLYYTLYMWVKLIMNFAQIIMQKWLCFHGFFNAFIFGKSLQNL